MDAVRHSLGRQAGAMELDPMLIKRLRRMRSSRQKARSARRLGVELESR